MRKSKYITAKLIHEVIYMDIQYFKLRKGNFIQPIIQGLGFENLK